MKYADIPELFILFSLYKIDCLKQIWEERIANDPSFIRTNVMLAKLYINLNYDALYLRALKYPRYEKLKLLAGRD